MSFFGFADIVFNKQGSPSGPLKALEGSQFETSTLRYPMDIGNYDKGHYMVFYIREQKKTSYSRGGIPDESINQLSVGRTFENLPVGSDIANSVGSQILNKFNSNLSQLNSATGGAIGGVTGALSSVAGSINNLFGKKTTSLTGDSTTTSSIIDNSVKNITDKSNIRTTRLTKDAIALYMPDTLLFSQQQDYSDARPGTQVLGQAAAVGKSLLDKYTRGEGIGRDELYSALKSAGLTAASILANRFGDVGRVAFRGLSGVAVNPMLELLYSSPAFRTFQFDFTFYPRDEREAFEVQKIIDRFRFHSSPELFGGTKDSKGFLVPPSEFDIRFYYGGSQNPNLSTIGTCVLTSIDVNYAPTGWSAYEIPGESRPALGRTGMPVAIQLTLQFKETTYLLKEDFAEQSSYWKPSAGE